MEVRRQLIHLSGLLFVILAQYTGGFLASVCFLMIAATFLIYSEHVRRERKRLLGLLEGMEKRIRDFAIGFERPGVARPFLGAFWFYVGCGISFLAFPMPVASAACAMLAVGDSFSTIIGSKFGKRALIGKKTIEGSVAFLVASLLIALIFVDPRLAIVGAIAATISELLPEAGRLGRARSRGLIDDNFLIPIIAGLVMTLL
jgi:dolichol kinase